MTSTLLRRLVLVAALLCGMHAASAQMQPMSEDELSAVNGQGLVTMTNSSLNGFDFSKIALDADITLSANLRNIRLGEYAYAARNGSGADLDIPLLQFGRSDGTDAQRVVQISNPYFEFVYKNAADGASREAIGMRFGFESISGDIGLRITTLSGSMQVTGTAADGSTIVLDSRTDGGGKRWDGACTAPCLTLSQLGGVTAGDASGGSRDFWISLLKTAVQFPTTNGAPANDTAQAGMWLNWRDKLQALATNGVAPPNLPKGR
ncbi:hypothetical protein GTP45_01835 [Pseudoduganella sp. FT55W]|uniref:Uncharacterized protein n=1 Tax=Duganella rivi TaxID=2666083 RepID=A0A7X4K9Z0_9BURK|nr:hypothetical protein [Duganella rivi]MYM65575.1 hypothetical protein [Duganella rivi]